MCGIRAENNWVYITDKTAINYLSLLGCVVDREEMLRLGKKE